MIRDNEAVHDERIAPLMTEIIAVCKAHGIPMFATFQYGPATEDAGAAMCTTRIPQEGEAEVFDRLHLALNRPNFMAFTVTTEPGRG